MAPGKAALWTALGLALLAGLCPCLAENPKEHADNPAAGVFWEVRQRQEAGAAAQLILAGDPLAALFVREVGFRWKVWREPEFLGDTAPALNSQWLDELRDGTASPDLRGKADDEIRQDQLAYVKTLTQAIVFANEAPVDAFAKSAEANAHVTFGDLWAEPGLYRGKVIPITGRLARLRKKNAPVEAQRKGVSSVYEGWIFGPTRGSHPFWVLFTTLPDGVNVAEKMNRQVTFNGYFLKKMPYPAADGSKLLQAPLLVGPTVTLVNEPLPPPSTSISAAVVACVVVVIAAVSIGLVVLSWYFHRGDQALKNRLARLQPEQGPELRDETLPESERDGARLEPQRPRPPPSGGHADLH
jgi:hypothetical protein